MPALGMTDAQVREHVQHELQTLELAAKADVATKGWRFIRSERLTTLSP